MGSRGEAELDLIGLLLADHRLLAEELAHLDQAGADEREELFPTVAARLVAHEVAEQQVVHPALRSTGEPGAPIVERRLAEESRAEELLTSMERMDPSTNEFASSVTELRLMVVEHAVSEEREAFPILIESWEVLDLPTMAVRYQEAKRKAPTHPHPHAPSTPPGNLALGPVASIVDRVRDALR